MVRQWGTLCGTPIYPALTSRDFEIVVSVSLQIIKYVKTLFKLFFLLLFSLVNLKLVTNLSASDGHFAYVKTLDFSFKQISTVKNMLLWLRV